MKQPGFVHGVIFAAVLAFSGSAVVAALTPFLGFASVLRLAIPALCLAYLLYLMRYSQGRTGRVTTLSLWSVLAAVTWWAAPPLSLYLLVHAAAIWLVRSLYFHSSFAPALIDLGLSFLSITASAWAMSRSGSLFLSIWTFFLVQALYVLIPQVLGAKARQGQPGPQNQEFRRAERQADAALRQLFRQ